MVPRRWRMQAFPLQHSRGMYPANRSRSSPVRQRSGTPRLGPSPPVRAIASSRCPGPGRLRALSSAGCECLTVTTLTGGIACGCRWRAGEIIRFFHAVQVSVGLVGLGERLWVRSAWLPGETAKLRRLPCACESVLSIVGRCFWPPASSASSCAPRLHWGCRLLRPAAPSWPVRVFRGSPDPGLLCRLRQLQTVT
jgi:hypothetical protein